MKSNFNNKAKGLKNKPAPAGKPSFSFAWDNKQKPTAGKVFKKKITTPPTETSNPTKPIIPRKATTNDTNATKPIFQRKVAQNQSPEQHSEPSKEGPVTNFSGNNNHIKRKQRKDKIQAKTLREQGGDFEPQQQKKGDGKNQAYSLFSEKQRDLYVNTFGGKSVSEVVFTEGTKFGALGIHRHLVSNLEKISFDVLTNVQAKAIPAILDGKNALVRSQTGSGKTLAYAVPIIDALQGITPKIKRADGVQALVVVPTRELALQTHQQFCDINTFQWIVTGHLCGGENRKTEKDKIRKGINVLIGTPGRLLDHVLHTSALNLSKVRCLVLDEADRLLDMGFRKDIMTLVEEIDKAKTGSDYDPMAIFKQNKKKTFGDGDDDDDDDDDDKEANIEKPDANMAPLKDVNSKERQTVLLSATLTEDVTELADLTMKDHVYIDALDEGISSKNEDDFVIPNTVSQEFIVTMVKHRLFTLSALIVAQSKANSKVFVFMASTHMVEFHHELFTKCLVSMPKGRGKPKTHDHKGQQVVSFDDDVEEVEEEEEVVVDVEFFKLHGNMDQKMRKKVFTAFRAAKKGVLLCTDVAARGLDVPEADCIIQYTPPQTDKDYLHRVGRTGRAGKSGTAIIFLTHEEQDYISHMRDHKVFLKQKDPKEFLFHLTHIMEEPNFEEAATALQRHYERRVAKDKDLHKSACFAYSTFSRFYNSYSCILRPIFDFKKINLGHYVTSFALTCTPTEASRVVRGQVSNVETKPLNRKLANHLEDHPPRFSSQKKRKTNMSEFSSGLEPMKKRKKQEEST